MARSAAETAIRAVAFAIPLEQFFQVLNTKPGLVENLSQCSRANSPMVWDHDTGVGQRAAQNHVTPLLPSELETDFLKSPSEFLA